MGVFQVVPCILWFTHDITYKEANMGMRIMTVLQWYLQVIMHAMFTWKIACKLNAHVMMVIDNCCLSAVIDSWTALGYSSVLE